MALDKVDGSMIAADTLPADVLTAPAVAAIAAAVEQHLESRLWKTGDFKGTTRNTLDDGWLWMDGRTIGNADSGATARANADCEALFIHLWQTFGNDELPIEDDTGTPTTRGASAEEDFAANKRLPVPDARGRVTAGRDDMGGTPAGRLTDTGDGNSGIDGTVLGAAGGEDRHTLTVDEMPAHTHSHDSWAAAGSATTGAGANFGTRNTGSTGGDKPHNNVQPTIVLNFMIKM